MKNTFRTGAAIGLTALSGLLAKLDAQVLANFSYDGSVATLSIENQNPNTNFSLESLVDTGNFTLAGYTGGFNIQNAGWTYNRLEQGNTDKIDSLSSFGDTFDVGYQDTLTITWGYNSSIATDTGSNSLRFMTDGGTAVDVSVANWLYESGQAPSAIPEPSTYAAILGALALLGFMIRRRTLKRC